ncbi:MAG: DUF1015 domain-containing protein [Acidobacteriota bacterium]|nr:DUF1015 domain-containing protein [Acidobacteriota bacterium]
MKIFDSLGLAKADILFPVNSLDLKRWAVIACDQFTSEPEYWERVAGLVGSAPSTFHLIYPEVYLNAPDKESRIKNIKSKMKEYLTGGIFNQAEGIVYVERETAHGWRKGLLLAVDLEKYDYRSQANTLIRATEGTILERIPPRVQIREGASLELPHIMMLIDDPENMVIGPASEHKKDFLPLYDFELMFDSGRIRGYLITRSKAEDEVLSGLSNLADQKKFCQRYNLSPEIPLLLFAVGDGNHSLATAKTIWEKTKAASSNPEELNNSPLRYALVEIVNLHDESLAFEPIHRILFDVKKPLALEDELKAFFRQQIEIRPERSYEDLQRTINNKKKNEQVAGLVSNHGFKSIRFLKPSTNLTAGTIQPFLDKYLSDKKAQSLDYVHGNNSLWQLVKKSENNTGIYLPALDKNHLFPTVILDGALPRKTFSMGEAWEKRFYLEGRKLTNR